MQFVQKCESRFRGTKSDYPALFDFIRADWVTAERESLAVTP